MPLYKSPKRTFDSRKTWETLPFESINDDDVDPNRIGTHYIQWSFALNKYFPAAGFVMDQLKFRQTKRGSPGPDVELVVASVKRGPALLVIIEPIVDKVLLNSYVDHRLRELRRGTRMPKIYCVVSSSAKNIAYCYSLDTTSLLNDVESYSIDIDKKIVYTEQELDMLQVLDTLNMKSQKDIIGVMREIYKMENATDNVL